VSLGILKEEGGRVCQNLLMIYGGQVIFGNVQNLLNLNIHFTFGSSQTEDVF
jgi:hypothetical protein